MLEKKSIETISALLEGAVEKIDKIELKVEDIDTKVTDLRIELAKLQVKSGLFGALLGGTSGFLLALGVEVFRHLLS